MRYEQLRSQILDCPGNPRHEGASIFIRRGMLVWMKSCVIKYDKRDSKPLKTSGNVLPSDSKNAVTLLLANMVLNNHQQGVYNV